MNNADQIKEPHFEGETFKVKIKIDSDACFGSNIALTTDYGGYKRLKELLEELYYTKQKYHILRCPNCSSDDITQDDDMSVVYKCEFCGFNFQCFEV